MKLAWKPLLFSLLFLCSFHPASAFEIVDYDPTQTYDVHSVSQENDEDPLRIGVSQQDDYVYAPEAGASGIPNRSGIETASTANVLGQQNWLQQFGGSVSSYLSNIVQPVTDFVSQQTPQSNIFESFFHQVTSNISYTAHAVGSFISSSVSTLAQDTYWAITHPIQNAKNNFWTIFGLAFSGTGLGVLALHPLGRSLIAGVAQIGFLAAISAIDLVLHAGTFITGSLISLFTGVTVTQGYQQAKNGLKKYIHHDIGSFTHDVQVVVTVAVVAASIYFGALLIAEGTVAAKVIATENPTQLSMRAQVAMNKTSMDCMNYAGQCDTPVGAGITLASNTLFGVSPQLTDDAARTGIAMRAEVSELNIGREFLEQNYGGVDSVAFQQAVKKYPNAFRVINEGEKTGHVIERHLVSDEFLIDRALHKDVVSSFNTSDDMLSSIEKALTDENSLKKINDELMNKNRPQAIVTFEMDKEVGRVLRKGTGEFEATNTVLVVFRKDPLGNIYVKTGYPVER